MIFILFILFAAFAALVTAAVATEVSVAAAPVAAVFAATLVMAPVAGPVIPLSRLVVFPHYYKEMLRCGVRYYRDPVSMRWENVEDILDYEDATPPVRTRKDKYGEDIHAPSSSLRTMESRNKEGRSRIYKKGKVKRVKAPHKRW